MDPESQTEVSELLEFKSDSAGGLMNTDYVALPDSATVAEARAEIAKHEDLLETLSAVYVVDGGNRLVTVVPLTRLLFAPDAAALHTLGTDPLQSVPVDERLDRVAEQFDKYNLLSLPVVDELGRLVGVITADDIISALREA